MKLDIKSLRERTNPQVSQSDLAVRIGKDQAQISRYENDPASIPADMLIQILKELGSELGPELEKLLSPGFREEGGLDAGTPYEPLRKRQRLLADYLAAGGGAIRNLPDGCPGEEQLAFLVRQLPRKPTLAVQGPVDSGKSSLINRLLGCRCLPVAYQPVTRIPIYLRHTEDKPDWMREQVWLFGEGFNPLFWDLEGHCRRHRVVAGGLEAVRDYGTFNGPYPDAADVRCAMAFVDAPLLRACNIVDLPGLDNSDSAGETGGVGTVLPETEVVIYTSHRKCFLETGDLMWLGEIIRRLPRLSGQEGDGDVLRNLYVLATHAAPELVTNGDVDALLDEGCSRVADFLRADLRNGGQGVAAAESPLRRRFFPFHVETPARRNMFEVDLKALLAECLPKSLAKSAERSVLDFKEGAKTLVKQSIDFHRQMLADGTSSGSTPGTNWLDQAKKRRGKLADKFAECRRESRKALDAIYAKHTSKEGLVRLIKEFKDNKRAEREAAALVVERIENELLQTCDKLGEGLSRLTREYFDACWQGMRLPLEGEPLTLSDSAKNLLMGGLFGVGTLAGGLALSSLALPAAAGLGMYGTVGAFALKASIFGGPVAFAVGTSFASTLFVISLFGRFKEDSLAKRIVKLFDREGVHEGFAKRLDDYWDRLEASFGELADRQEKALAKLAEEWNGLLSGEDWKQKLEHRIRQLEDARDFFGGIPWQPLD